jgi:hypothetical protein
MISINNKNITFENIKFLCSQFNLIELDRPKLDIQCITDMYFKCFSQNFILSEETIDKFESQLDWNSISIYQNLSHKLISKYQHKLNWNHISRFQKLSEITLIKFKQKLNWNFISLYQSPEIYSKFKHLLS